MDLNFVELAAAFDTAPYLSQIAKEMGLPKGATVSLERDVLTTTSLMSGFAGFCMFAITAGPEGNLIAQRLIETGHEMGTLLEVIVENDPDRKLRDCKALVRVFRANPRNIWIVHPAGGGTLGTLIDQITDAAKAKVAPIFAPEPPIAQIRPDNIELARRAAAAEDDAQREGVLGNENPDPATAAEDTAAQQARLDERDTLGHE